MRIQILIDNPNSWIVPFGKDFNAELKTKGFDSTLLHSHDHVKAGDILALLACEKILTKAHRALNKYNLVVHESALPEGKGWSPLTWQVLQGKSKIPVSLIEAADSVDAGVIYEQVDIELAGHELVAELREKQAKASFDLLKNFIKNFPNNIGKPQAGTESFFPRRTAKDSELNIQAPLAEQFNLLRVVDNERYPAHFHFQGHKYVLKIEKE